MWEVVWGIREVSWVGALVLGNVQPVRGLPYYGNGCFFVALVRGSRWGMSGFL